MSPDWLLAIGQITTKYPSSELLWFLTPPLPFSHSPFLPFAHCPQALLHVAPGLPGAFPLRPLLRGAAPARRGTKPRRVERLGGAGGRAVGGAAAADGPTGRLGSAGGETPQGRLF